MHVRRFDQIIVTQRRGHLFQQWIGRLQHVHCVQHLEHFQQLAVRHFRQQNFPNFVMRQQMGGQMFDVEIVQFDHFGRVGCTFVHFQRTDLKDTAYGLRPGVIRHGCLQRFQLVDRFDAVLEHLRDDFRLAVFVGRTEFDVAQPDDVLVGPETILFG